MSATPAASHRATISAPCGISKADRVTSTRAGVHCVTDSGSGGHGGGATGSVMRPTIRTANPDGPDVRFAVACLDAIALECVTLSLSFARLTAAFERWSVGYTVLTRNE